MALTVNTNIASINARNNLNKTSSAMTKSLKRLSTGLRINSAKDDAAGLGISNRMGSQIRGLDQAMRNANDGISLAQTAEGALSETTTNLQRLRDLAVQAANDSNTDADRQSIQEEVNQLVAEINRIADTTSFNNKKILNGETSKLSFQIGANANQTIDVEMENARANQLGNQAGNVQSTGSRASLANGAADSGAIGIQEVGTGGALAAGAQGSIAAGDVTVQTAADSSAVSIAVAKYGGDILTASATDLKDTNSTEYGGGQAKAIAERINSIRELKEDDTDNEGHTVLEGVYASAKTEFKASDLQAADYAGTSVAATNYTNVGAGSIDHDGLVINGVKVGPAEFQENDADGSLRAAINSKSDITGVTASINDDGELLLTAEDGRDIILSTDSERSTNLLFAGGGTEVTGKTDFNQDFTDLRITGKVTVSAQDSITLSGGTGKLEAGFTTLDEDNVQATGSIQNADVTTIKGANNLIEAADSALSQVDSMRSKLGAVQNRLESTISNLSNVSENLSASRSRIVDADFASETANMTKQQIMMQAGTAMLGQANQLPQSVLSLLG